MALQCSLSDVLFMVPVGATTVSALAQETDPRFGAAASFDEYIQESPEDLRALFLKSTAIPVCGKLQPTGLG